MLVTIRGMVGPTLEMEIITDYGSFKIRTAKGNWNHISGILRVRETKSVLAEFDARIISTKENIEIVIGPNTSDQDSVIASMGYQVFEVGNKVSLKIESTAVRHQFRGNDLNTMMFATALASHPNINLVYSELRGTNLASVLSHLIENLKSHPKYRQPGTSMKPNTLDDVWANFHSCCEGFSDKDLEPYLIEAIKSSAAFKVREKFGFSVISAPRMNRSGRQSDVTFDATK